MGWFLVILTVTIGVYGLYKILDAIDKDIW